MGCLGAAQRYGLNEVECVDAMFLMLQVVRLGVFRRVGLCCYNVDVVLEDTLTGTEAILGIALNSIKQMCDQGAFGSEQYSYSEWQKQTLRLI